MAELTPAEWRCWCGALIERRLTDTPTYQAGARERFEFVDVVIVPHASVCLPGASPMWPQNV